MNYKINDRVVVEFLGKNYNSTITSMYKHDDKLFCVLADDGTKIPAVGYDTNKGKWANIISKLN
jgi:hypothetical protein